MFADNFAPNPASTIIVTPAPTTSSATVVIPPGGNVLELTNTGTVTVYIEQGVGAATATVPSGTPGSYGVQPGQCKLVRRLFVGGQGCTVIATITAASTGALQVAVGDGQ